MSAWGPGLYEDDTACDVRDDYVGHLKAGLSHPEACQKILARQGDLLRQTEVACLVVFALADTAWRHGRLDETLQARALSLLQAGGDVFVWERDAPGDAAARRRVLQALAERLSTPQPAPQPIQIVPPPAKRVRTTASVGSVFALGLPSSGAALLVLVGFAELEGSIDPVFSILQRRWGSPSDAPSQIPGNHPTLALTIGPQRTYNHVAILPRDERRNILTGLAPVNVQLASPLPFQRGHTVWLSLGRIATEIDRHL